MFDFLICCALRFDAFIMAAGASSWIHFSLSIWHFRKHSKEISSKLGTRNKRHFVSWEKQGFAAICWAHKRATISSDWSQKSTKPVNYGKYLWGLNWAKSWHIPTVRGKASLQIIISLITLGLKKKVVTLIASFVAFMQNPTCNTEIQKNLIRFADSELVLPTEPDV